MGAFADHAGTLEDKIDQLLESKRELVEKVMAGTSDDWLGDLDLGAIRAAVALAPDAYEEAVHDGAWTRAFLDVTGAGAGVRHRRCLTPFRSCGSILR